MYTATKQEHTHKDVFPWSIRPDNDLLLCLVYIRLRVLLVRFAGTVRCVFDGVRRCASNKFDVSSEPRITGTNTIDGVSSMLLSRQGHVMSLPVTLRSVLNPAARRRHLLYNERGQSLDGPLTPSS